MLFSLTEKLCRSRDIFVIGWVDMNPVAQELSRNVFIGFYLPQGLTICNFGVTFCI